MKDKAFHTTMILRAVTILIALSFIPAFIFGVASVWSVVFAVVLALFFDARLQGILTATDLITNEKQKCWATIKHYFLLMVEVTIISSIAPVILLYSGWGDLSIITTIDAYMFNYAPLNFASNNAYSDNLFNVRVLIAVTGPVIFTGVITLLLSYRKLSALSANIIYEKTKKEEVKQATITSSLYSAYFDFSFYFIFAIPLLYFLVISFHLEDGLFSNISCMSAIILSYMTYMAVLKLLFTSSASFKKI